MTDLQRVEISGFKGIEHLAYEPSGINLVTGRNNTGKTSLLEAIALAFDPTYVGEFGEDIDSLIHEDFEECRILVETEEETREMEIRHPTEEEAEEYFVSRTIRDVENIVSAHADPSHLFSREGAPDMTDMAKDRIARIVRSTTNVELEGGLTDELLESCLVFSISGDENPYIYPGDAVQDLVRHSIEKFVDIIESEQIDIFEHQITSEEVRKRLSMLGESSGLTFPLPGFRFMEEPSTLGKISFIKSKNLLSAPDFDPDSDDAIKRDDLGDYLKETGLAEELKTFNLDTLVFEKEDGEKYAVPYDFMGDGFKTMVGLLWELMDDEIEDQIILLEEPENHMHPGYVRKVVYFLVELAKDEDVQLFITTHNKDFIDTFFTENLRDEEVEFLEEEFTLVRMESHSAVVEDYETARESIEDLHLDLRGI